MALENQRRAPKKFRSAALLIASVLLGIPLILAAWIAMIFAAERFQIEVAPHVLFAWILSLLVAVLLWPMSMRGMRRYFWATRTAAPDSIPALGSRRFEAEPKSRLSLGQVGARSGAVLAGMASLLLICGPGDISRGLLEGLDAASSGSSSWWSALQLGTLLLAMLVFLPAL